MHINSVQQRKLVVGNWKMHGSLAANTALLNALRSAETGPAEVVVCPPFPYLAQAATLLAGSAIGLGAQNCGHEAGGAYTGEVAAAMLLEFGCRYVIVGHSERRADFGDDDARVARKVLLALEHGLTPILCIGESLAQQQAGETRAVLQRQLQAVLTHLEPARIEQLVIAYEPIWAIGTGLTATADYVADIAGYLHQLIAQAMGAADNRPAVRLLYGGSVNAASADWLRQLPDIAGVLVGGASLKADQFDAICQAFS
ncbi:triose-phosphate isomerase [Chitinimonas arctica]|uniref:Triosephosphate isomerase n=1 Tax=Chitinimonas arctica TaxID=2594795 RepID=A0A516SB74_9NEIS|nr:triose-phosphate isomerase [Chitinimonas arctica]QDQ25399.1 triose-phosphate isomerase [Chitinimonas arctica]